MNEVYVGIDPGKVNLGLAMLDSEGKKILTEVMNPSKGSISETVKHIASLIPQHSVPVVGMERYVAYKGVVNEASEYILMLIGAILYEFESKGEVVRLFRAIDWKPSVCKTLFKQSQFKNPSLKFDKTYSLAAAQAILPDLKPKEITDHEADAVCLAFHVKTLMEKK